MTDSQVPRPWRFGLADWVALSVLLLTAGIVRVVFFSGLIGSDDVTYTERALAALHGDWTTSNYVGAIRYGVNLPMAAIMAVFGSSEFNANLWALACSLGEVAIVFLLAKHLWGRRAAMFSALILTLLPLHVNLSGRVFADTPLTFFITLCFALFYFGELNRNRWLYLAAGLSLGAVYWVKESVVPLVVPVFLLYAIVRRTFRKDWIWAILGGGFMLLLNMALMWWSSGDALQMFRAMARGVDVAATWDELYTSPGYYFYYLFVDGRHTWIMPFLSVAGLWSWWRNGPRASDTGYVVIWGLGLLLILSFAVISLSPFRFLYKQTNYMLIFAAPLALLAGYALAKIKGKPLVVVMFLLISGSLVLSALEQQAIRVFTANSRAALAFAATHSEVPIYGTRQAYSLSSVLSALHGQWPPRPSIENLTELAANDSRSVSPNMSSSSDLAAYVILDTETAGWGRGQPRIGPAEVPSCWKNIGILEPSGFGSGAFVLGVLRDVAAALLPESLARQALRATDSLYRPRPAYVYAVPAGCSFRLKDGRDGPLGSELPFLFVRTTCRQPAINTNSV